MSGTGPTGVSGTGTDGPGVSGTGPTGVSGTGTADGPGGSFGSTNVAQLHLVPSSTPIEDTSLFQTGQVGDLYLFSVAEEVGTSGTFDFNTILWLCVSPAAQHLDNQAVWAPVQLGDTVGG